jgi:hypothetical protein
MPGRPLTAIATLGILVCGATVGLEAVGVLFQAGASNSGQRTDVFLALLEADLDSQVAPSRPVDLPNEPAAVEPVWLDPPATAEPAPDTGSETADAPTDRAGDKKMVVAFTTKIPHSLPPQSLSPEERESAPPEETASPPEAERPPLQPAAQDPEPVVVQPAVQATEAVRPEPPRLAPRSRSARADRAAAGGFGCPLLDWLSM